MIHSRTIALKLALCAAVTLVPAGFSSAAHADDEAQTLQCSLRAIGKDDVGVIQFKMMIGEKTVQAAFSDGTTWHDMQEVAFQPLPGGRLRFQLTDKLERPMFFLYSSNTKQLFVEGPINMRGPCEELR